MLYLNHYLKESVDKDTIINDFKLYLNDINVSEKDVTESVVNDYFSGLFYDIETDEDLADLNKAEEVIKREYNVVSDDYYDAFDPKDDDWDDINHWYNDDPREEWDKMNESEHNIKEPYDRSKGQIKQITDLCDNISNRTGKEISFDNHRGFNHYVLICDGEEYDFNLYRDVIAALELLNKFI